MRITREQLYKEIWRAPATKLAQRYDVSSSYLARVCEGLNVPHPPRGHWARKAAGEKMPIPPLPPARPGDPLSWEKGVAVMERLPPLELPPPEPKSNENAKGARQRPRITRSSRRGTAFSRKLRRRKAGTCRRARRTCSTPSSQRQ